MNYGMSVLMHTLRRGFRNGEGLWALTRLVFLCSVMSVGMDVSAHAQNVTASATVVKEAWCDCDGEVRLTISGCQVGGIYRFSSGSFNNVLH